jgi:hypothetical protein
MSFNGRKKKKKSEKKEKTRGDRRCSGRPEKRAPELGSSVWVGFRRERRAREGRICWREWAVSSERDARFSGVWAGFRKEGGTLGFQQWFSVSPTAGVHGFRLVCTCFPVILSISIFFFRFFLRPLPFIKFKKKKKTVMQMLPSQV